MTTPGATARSKSGVDSEPASCQIVPPVAEAEFGVIGLCDLMAQPPPPGSSGQPKLERGPSERLQSCPVDPWTGWLRKLVRPLGIYRHQIALEPLDADLLKDLSAEPVLRSWIGNRTEFLQQNSLCRVLRASRTSLLFPRPPSPPQPEIRLSLNAVAFDTSR